MKLGNYPVLATDHTLVLGWNSAAMPLLRQMASAKAQYPRPTAFQRCAAAPLCRALRKICIARMFMSSWRVAACQIRLLPISH